MTLRRTLAPRWWWLALAALLLLGGVLRFIGYDFGLPYVEHPDEPNFYLTGLEWRGLYNDQNYLAGYPPLYIWLNIIVQRILEPFAITGLAATVRVLRLIATAFNLITLLLIAFTAERAAGRVAGLIAGAAWAVAPLVVEHGVYAIPDPLVYLLVIASIAVAVVALTDEARRHWCVWSIVAGCLAILTKYYVLTAILPGIIAALLIYRRDSRRVRRYLVLQGAIIALTLLVSVLGIAILGREGQAARTQGFANVLDPTRVMNNLYHAVLPINPLFFALVVLLGVVAYGIVRRTQRVRLDVVALCLLILVTTPWLAAAFSVVTVAGRIKDVLPATTVACVILGIGLAQVSRILPPLLRGLVIVLPVLLVFAPQLSADISLIRQRLLPDSRVALRQWADTNLAPGTVLVGAENHKTFNPYWGGIEGQHWFDWIEIDDITEKPPEAWRGENGASYAVINQSLAGNAAGREYLAQMLYLQDFGSVTMRGPQVHVYRLQPIQHSVDAQFGDAIRLIGYDFDTTATAPGGSFTLTFYWRAVLPPTDNYSLFVHLVPQGSDRLIAQIDGSPARPERLPVTWTDSDETLISQPFTLTLPNADVPAGDYDLRVGLYNFQSGMRLPVVSNMDNLGDALVLTRLTIQ